MPPELTIALLWLGFGATHVTLSSAPTRARLVDALGLPAFLGLYSAVAFAFFVPLVFVYFGHRHEGPVLWGVGVGPGGRWVVYLGMAAAFVLLVSSLLRPSPAGIVAGSPTPYGVYRITRHPQNMALALFGGLHLIPNGAAADVVFFGGFVAFGLVGSWHQDRRKLAAGVPGFAAFVAGTPFLPFTGRETIRGLRELSPVGVALGVGAAILVRHFHGAWFGG